jgi:hypothetical protein
LNRRDEQIATLKATTDKLDEGRLAHFYRKIVDSYETESKVDGLARIKEENDREPSGFRVLVNQETRLLAHFNDPSYYWDLYCEEFGRSVARREEQYVFEKIAELPPSELTVDARHPSFSVIQEAVENIERAHYRPSMLFAPTALFVTFNTDSTLHIDWNSDPREALVMADGRRLPIAWSSHAVLFNRFVVADTTAGIWSVKLDPETQHRLTVAIGRPKSPRDTVVFLAETVCNYEVAHPEGFCVIDVEGEPPDDSASQGNRE